MELLLVNKELAESRLYRSSQGFGTFTGKEIANMLYLQTLVTYMMSLDAKQRKLAVEYAARSSQYSTYSLFRTHATDLYLLAYQVNLPDNDHVKLQDTIASKKFLNSLNFNTRRHISFLRELGNEKNVSQQAPSFFYRLETQLKISDSKYKRWRRLVSDWSNLKYPAKQTVIAQIVQELRIIGKGTGKRSEIMYGLNPMLKQKSFRNSRAIDKPEKASMLKRAAGTVAGAAAGRYIAKKVSDTPRSKNIGTGLGAIAGYWASGRKPQK